MQNYECRMGEMPWLSRRKASFSHREAKKSFRRWSRTFGRPLFSFGNPLFPIGRPKNLSGGGRELSEGLSKPSEGVFDSSGGQKYLRKPVATRQNSMINRIKTSKRIEKPSLRGALRRSNLAQTSRLPRPSGSQ